MNINDYERLTLQRLQRYGSMPALRYSSEDVDQKWMRKAAWTMGSLRRKGLVHRYQEDMIHKYVDGHETMTHTWWGLTDEGHELVMWMNHNE